MKIKQTLFKSAFLLTAVAMLALTRPAIAGDQVPFKGEETGVITTVSFHFPFDTKAVVAEGEATHFGHYTLVAAFVVDVRVGTVTGTYAITTDNGDMLSLNMVGAVVPTDFTKTILNFTVTGGTGRFENATGSFTAHNQLAFRAGTSPNPYVGQLEGTLSTPGANKK
jgi:hypothetical protein